MYTINIRRRGRANDTAMTTRTRQNAITLIKRKIDGRSCVHSV